MTTHKDRLMFLLELLNKETDEDHPITVAEIINRLNAEGFTSTRKKVAKDIDIKARRSSVCVQSIRHALEQRQLLCTRLFR